MTPRPHLFLVPRPATRPTVGPAPVSSAVERADVVSTDTRPWCPDDVPDTLTPPSVIEIGAARRYVNEFYTMEQFVDICKTQVRAGMALEVYLGRTWGRE